MKNPKHKVDLDLLIATPYDKLKVVFPDVPRSYLVNLKNETIGNMSIKERLEYQRNRSNSNHLRNQYNEIAKRNEELERLIEASFKLKNPIQTFKIESKEGEGSEAVAFIIASDWHIEEEVKSGTINGLNSYNLSISDERTTKFFQNALKLLKMTSRDIKIETVVLALLGDFISGSIHEELMESNQLLPGDAIWRAQNIIVSGIDYLLQNTNFKFIIPCAPGNHSRITKKQRHATEQGNSLETYMYRNLAMHYSKEKRINFILSESYLTYLNVFHYKIRLHHGHNLQYGGGVGGLTIPVNKAISQWNKAQPVDLDVFGHWHQFFDGGNFICNGSVIGYNAYAQSIKASFEKPKQAFFLIDKKRGKTVVCPILFD
jgi:hypothetical protein